MIRKTLFLLLVSLFLMTETFAGEFKYLHKKYATISCVFGHYQQDAVRNSGLYIENVPDYRSEKIDPGYIFMTALKSRLQGEGLKFYDN